MSTIPSGQKFHTVASNINTVERGSSLSNAGREVYTMQDIADTVSAGLPPAPVLNTYPVTTPALAGTKFFYAGNEWHYMTQNEINSAGWNGLVTVGFPAPVSKNFNIFILTPELRIIFQTVAAANFTVLYENQTFTCDFLGLGDPTKARVALTLGVFNSTPYTVSFRNANLLSNLQDFGTSQSFTARYGNLTSEAINQLFTDLPSTTNTATINVSNNPGSATCNPTIATSKGYIVVV